MLHKNKKCSLGLIAGISAAVVVMSVGGYLMHKKIMKRRSRKSVQKQAANFAVFDLDNDNDLYNDYDDHDKGYYDSLIKDLQQGDDE